MVDYERILRDVNLAGSMQPAEELRLMDAVRRVIDPTGKIVSKAAAPFRTPLGFDWDPGSTAKKRVKRAGTLTLLAAHCGTAPDTAIGDATVTLTMERSDGSGIVTLGTLTIPAGQTMADTTLGVAVPAGAWMVATVTTANGASGVSISATVDVGGS